MNHILHKHWIWVLPLMLVGVALGSLCVGEISISPAQILTIGNNPESMEYGVLTYIRLPRTLLAIAIGGGLNIAGAILQGIFRNPLVEPYTLGISGGASLGVALAVVLGWQLTIPFMLPLMGFFGAFLSIFLVYVLSLQRQSIHTLRMLLVGVMVSFVASAIVMFLLSIATTEGVHNIIFWTMGSLNESNPLLVYGMVALSLLSLLLSYLFVSPLNALRLGEPKARHLGINTRSTIRLMFLLTSALTGSCIAVAGVIGFVGLIIPQFSRQIVGANYRNLLLASFLCGGIFLLVCDMLARTIIAPNELPIGVITGMVGGIFFIILLCRSKWKIS